LASDHGNQIALQAAGGDAVSAEFICYPVRIEIFSQESKGIAATVETQDDGGAMVEIKTVTNAEEWTKLSAAIRQALLSMKLEGDVTE